MVLKNVIISKEYQNMFAEVTFVSAVVGSWGFLVYKYNDEFSTRGSVKKNKKT